MKKRLLITSIVMMLVVAVALSTATYAWFTSSDTVSAEAVLLTASTMEGDAILISRSANNTGLSNTINLAVAGTDKLYPATPNAEDAFTNLGTGKFINLEVDGTNQAKTKAISGVNKSYYTDTFYVYNKGFSDVILAPVVSIYFNSANGASLDAARSVRIAIIEEKGSWVSGALTFANPVLKNIYEYDDDATTASAVSTYVKAPSTYAEGTFYTLSGTTYTVDDTVTELNYDEKKDDLYVLEASTSDVNVAKAGALTGYGAETEDQTPTAASVYTQRDDLEFDDAAYTTVLAPASGTYIANKYTVVIWLEGWDGQCTNAMSAGLFRVGLSIAKA